MGVVDGIAFAAVMIAALGACTTFGLTAVNRSDKAGDAAAKAAELAGKVDASNAIVTAAREAVKEIAAARDRQEMRANALELELHDLETNPILTSDAGHPGRAQLRQALKLVAADRARESTGSGDGSGPRGVSDGAPAGAVGSSGASDGH